MLNWQLEIGAKFQSNWTINNLVGQFQFARRENVITYYHNVCPTYNSIKITFTSYFSRTSRKLAKSWMFLLKLLIVVSPFM